MGFVLDGLEAEDYDRTYSDSSLINRIVAYFRPHLRAMGWVALAVVLATIAESASPFVISRGIDMLAGNPAAQAAVALAASIALLRSVSWVFNFIRQSFSARVVGDVVLKLREDAFQAVMQRDMSFFDQYASGKIVSRVTSDTQDFSNTVTLTMDLFSQFLLVLMITALLFVININLALIVLATTPLVFIVALSFRRIARSVTQRSQRATGEVNSTIQETISGIAVAKSFRQEAAIYGDFKTTNALVYRVRLLRGWILFSIFPTLDIISGVITALVVYIGAQRTLGGVLTAGEWFLFVQVLNYLIYPLTSIALILEPVPTGAFFQRAGVCADRRRPECGAIGQSEPRQATGPDRIRQAVVRLQNRRQHNGKRSRRPRRQQRATMGVARFLA